MDIRIKKTPPAQRLPFDVLWFLFRYVVSVDGDAGPTTISHVCKLWRQSALDTPLLWTKITMRLYFYKQKHQRAEARFNRSANLPLDLTFHCSRNLQEPERDTLIIPHAHRIRSLVVHCKGGILSEWMWMRLNIHMPRLEEFNTIISRVPALRAVRKVTSLEDVSNLVPFVPNNRPTAWLGWVTRGLTSLRLATLDFCTEISMMELFSILEYAAVTLQEFEYEGYTPPSTHFPLSTSHSYANSRFPLSTIPVPFSLSSPLHRWTA
ncbi:hypothetical protein GALMADRAFT_743486 [Galerina marginata CBS 339.88]|uniref:Uncharacterized protein n=1 Tax=Galerina marginata (strain CBS 339.88) TaxID=685588 RepID=A0A067SQ35_GALM3|nr:hypothetical protein GALMADRAFT_743486 [Galerina marginata CBS 339.88]